MEGSNPGDKEGDGERKERKEGEGEGEGPQHTTEGAEAGPGTADRQGRRDDSAVSTRRGLLNSADFLFTLVDSSLLMSSSSSSSEMSS